MIIKDKYPEQYNGVKLNWIENKPFKKKGDQVIILKDEKYQLITLESVSKEPMQIRWIKRLRCRSCIRPGTVIDVSKYVYRWNGGLFTEGAELDTVKELNRLRESAANYSKQADEYYKKAALFNQLKATLDGEIIDNSDY